MANIEQLTLKLVIEPLPLPFACQSGEKADLDIAWATRDHGDAGKRAFDGPGGTLAHAFYPC